ncbi:hypothetical protein FACS189461_5880 [Spirochaetia bacterium]|nr:hypothetical protein FACS189461_5880 [Spirochaetia bacterium]
MGFFSGTFLWPWKPTVSLFGAQKRRIAFTLGEIKIEIVVK